MRKIAISLLLAIAIIGIYGCSETTTTTGTTIATTTAIPITTQTTGTTQATTIPATTTVVTTAPTTLATSDTEEPTTTLTGLALAIEQLANPLNLALFITDDPTTKMGFNFELPTDEAGYVEIAAEGTQTYIRHEAESKSRAIGNRTVHLRSLTIDQLTPGETYSYRVTNADNSIASDYHQFTLPTTEATEFTFMFLPDPQETWDYGYRIYAANIISVLEYAKTNYDFVVVPGDIINDADVRSQWNWFFRYSSVYSFTKPLAATSGNHDVSGFNRTSIQAMEYDGYLNLPTNGPAYEEFTELADDLRQGNFDNGKTYSFDYGNAHFVMINTEMFCDGTTACPAFDTVNATILENWLKADLAANAKPWSIIVLHRGPYSSSYDTVSVRNRLAPIFDEYGVDLVLAGHDHQYSRAVYADGELIEFDIADTPAFGEVLLAEESGSGRNLNLYASVLGTTYLTGNTTGTKFYGSTRSSGISVNYKFAGEYPVISMITVMPTGIEVKSYAVVKATNLTLEPSSIVLLERFTILKEHPET